jgi:chemotaxis protein MotB
MARKKKHEDHVNHEAWAIPYGDLVTLLFALFTVMYAMSSVNEGKFRVLSDAMIAAFNGAPKSVRPVNLGEPEQGKGGDKPLIGITPTALIKIKGQENNPSPPAIAPLPDSAGSLIRMEREVQDAMRALIDAKLITVRRESMWLEIEINTDILFPSGSGAFSTAAEPVLDKLAEVLKPFPNPIRVEGHTDDRPIHTGPFPSNWELSAARAASVVHQFTKEGIDPLRLEMRIDASPCWCLKRCRPPIRPPQGPRATPPRPWHRVLNWPTPAARRTDCSTGCRPASWVKPYS